MHDFARWLLLVFSAGAVNAGAYLAADRFAGHMTGTVTLIGVDVSNGLLLFEYSLVLISFVLGAAAAALILMYHDHLEWALLAVEGIALICLALIGRAGWLGEFSQAAESRGDFILLIMIAVVMGLQNAVSSMHRVRTTHLTGEATDLGIELARMLTKGDPAAKRAVLLSLGKFFVFAMGASTMAALTPRWTHLAFLLPALTVLAATVDCFRRRPRAF